MFNIREGDHLYIAVEGGNIVLRKMTDSCTFCGAETGVTQFKGKGICNSCRAQLDS
jgi:transcriptional pleiotropic regulator of transition state genes